MQLWINDGLGYLPAIREEEAISLIPVSDRDTLGVLSPDTSMSGLQELMLQTHCTPQSSTEQFSLFMYELPTYLKIKHLRLKNLSTDVTKLLKGFEDTRFCTSSATTYIKPHVVYDVY